MSIIKDGDIDVVVLAKKLWRLKWIPMVTAVLGAGLAIGYSYKMIPEWTAVSVFTSSSKENNMGSLLSIVGLGGAGSSGGKYTMYEEVVKSSMFLEPLLAEKWTTLEKDSVSLSDIYKISPDKYKAQNRVANQQAMAHYYILEALREAIKINSEGKGGAIRLEVTAPDPILALEMNRRVLLWIQEYNNRDNVYKAKKDRIFAEEQLADFSGNLEHAEARYSQFKRSNQSRDDPSLALEGSRLLRDVELWTSMMIEFRKQVQLARLNEQKEKSFIDVIDEPQVPIFKSKPKRKVMAMLGGAGGVLFGCLVALLVLFRRELRHLE